ncbi:helix-turn-helix transcriptional regulator [Pectobacteriaceae bacterium CE70]|uniref:XRE family transcriptional regulator n=1 Tax=Serratia sp. (strain ATCC 39006) TaxID=104623 RepID=A0A2I5TBT4_SERS3|nr:MULTISPECIES: helix-turn-helix transcriptional regulator [Enterobacterales]WJV59100.1 helix-turn-helix transcriptional regulator [Pectobacteriaceae bacterium C111]WJV63364.1 helix-turn-helix transcriptional regulator [Pectobacteriaceae bacterium C52]WJV67736.1 helix-turn-helix transcriptional regulator [Pectobacteriaceae bacterium CE70]WJY11679.1 helix-turn-helix transcriptional regulator [Pectobacteriaceae bacterium C80]WJY14265.1 helix-turn-helix transcriptional regulator [Pectobacteriace
MKTTNAQRKVNIIKNIEYLMRTRGETKASFSNRTGVTRTTIYKILDGRVNNVQQSTVNRISDFFGVSCEEIEDYDLEKVELLNKTISFEGNRNPSAVPIIPQSELLSVFEQKIGQLTIQYPLTYFFGDEANMLAIKVETAIGDQFSPNDTIIIKRPPALVLNTPMLCYSYSSGFIIQSAEEQSTADKNKPHDIKLLGYIIEERL